MIDLDALRQRWLEEEPRYTALAEYMKSLLIDETRRRGLVCRVEARAKDTASFLKKVIRKREEYGSPFDQMPDIVGARIILLYHDDIPAAHSIIEQMFGIIPYEDKTLQLGVDRVGYLGIHYDVTLPDRFLQGDRSLFAGLHCEVQLATAAQRLWADVAHVLMYKPAQQPPPEIRRMIHRLAPLVEIFDDQIERARDVILRQPQFEEAELLRQLERHFYRLTARDFDRALSLEILGKLKDLLTPSEIAGFDASFAEFVKDKQQALDYLYRAYANDQRCSPLLFQPETLLVFKQLDEDQYALRGVWEQILPGEMLNDLAVIWGRPFAD